MASLRETSPASPAPSSTNTPIAARRSWLAAAAVVFAVVGHSEPAEACGGAFFPARSTSVAVTGHQMAISISRNETIVWDRIETSGLTDEIAWVIPIKEGTRLELASEQFFTTLANATAPTVTEPAKSSGGGGGGGGCMGGSADDGSASLGTPNKGAGGVEVLDRQNIGPYETVRLRASAPGALHAWLTENEFAIPKAVEPVLDAYTREGFDFLALKVRAGAGQGLQPLRLVAPGADPTLPLRMSRAGVTTVANLTFYVLGEGRYSARGFEETKVAAHRLAFIDGQSNYDEVVIDQLAETGVPRFVVEASQANDALLEQHRANADANCVSSGNGQLDGTTTPTAVTVCAKDDIAAARRHLQGPMWITRLRTRFPADAFDKDLSFMASPDQSAVSPNHVVGATPSATIAPTTAKLDGSLLVIAGTVVGLAMIKRRRRVS